MPKHLQRILIASLAGLLLAPMLAMGGESRRQQFILGDNTERIFIQGIRPMGMGGAFIAVADDENAAFYNPAGLARIDYWRFTFPKLRFGSDINSWDNLTYYLSNISAFEEFMRGDTSPEVIAVVDRLSNTRIHLMNDFQLTYIQPGSAFGIYLFDDALLETGAILLPEASWNVRAGFIENFAMGFGWDIPQFGYLSTGFNLKLIQQMKSLEENRSVTDLSDIEMTTQWGGGLDIGLLYQPTDEITVAFVWADIYTRLLQEVMVPNVQLGFAYKPWWLNFEDLASVLAVDLVELNWQGDNEWKNSPNNAGAINFTKFRVGVEFLLSGLIALRGGMHQGYPTAGISLTTSFINIDWAYFGKEQGTYPGQHPSWEQRLSIDWHTGAPAIRHTPTASPTPTMTVTPTVTATPTRRPTAQATLTGKVPKLRGTFIGFTGTLTIVPKLPDDLGEVQSWNLKITNRRGKVLKTYKGTGFPEKSYVWNAKYKRKRVSSKAHYPFSLTVKTVAGGTKTVAGTLLITDTIPKLYTSKNYEVYPDKVYFSIQSPLKNTKSWKLDIIDAANNVIRSYRTQEELFKAFAWDAKDENGTVVPNNTSYRYELTYIDQSDNQILIADKLRPVLGQVYPNENRLTIKVGGILFDTGKAYLTAEMFDKVLKSAYLVLDEPSCQTVMEGHTDSTGPRKLNMKLSLVRAESVRRFLVDQQSVPDYQLGIKGWGPTKPIATNRTAAGRKKNRRVEVIIRIPQ